MQHIDVALAHDGARVAADRPLVLHVITHLDLGGAEVMAMRLVEELHGRFRAAVFAVLQEDAPGPIGERMSAQLRERSVPVLSGTRRGFKSGGVAIAAWSLARAIARLRPAMVHLHTEIPELTYAVATLLSPGLRRMPVVRTVHNSTLWIDWDGIGRWVTRRMAKVRADAVAVSRSAADADAAIAVPGRPAASIIYNGVPVPARRAAPMEQGAPVRLLFAGRFVHQKGADLLPGILRRAAALARPRAVHVTIAGTGTMAAELEQAFAAVDIGWSVEMVAPIPDLAGRVAEYQGVLMPSRFEGFGLVALEVLLAGVPLVATHAPGLNETIPADYPLLAPVDDVEALARAVASLVDDPEGWRRRVAPVGDGLAERFSPAGMAQAYAARYERLIGREAE